MTVWKWTDFDEILDRMDKILAFSGIGHSANIHTAAEKQVAKYAERMKVGRVNCQHAALPWSTAEAGSTASRSPTTIGCGTWAGNITSDNVNCRHLLNYTWVSTPVAEHVPTDEELFSDYLKKWGRD